jgi:hypothetical protein
VDLSSDIGAVGLRDILYQTRREVIACMTSRRVGLDLMGLWRVQVACTQCCVGTSRVVMDAPLVDDLCLPETVDDFPIEALVRELLFCHPGFLAGHRNEEGTVGKVYHRCVIAHSSIPDPAIACLPLTSAFGP